MIIIDLIIIVLAIWKGVELTRSFFSDFKITIDYKDDDE